MAVKKKGGRWAGAKKSGSAAAGKAKAQADRKLQREGEQRRKKAGGNGKESYGEADYPHRWEAHRVSSFFSSDDRTFVPGASRPGSATRASSDSVDDKSWRRNA